MGLNIIDYPPSPPVMAEEVEPVLDLDWLELEGEEELDEPSLIEIQAIREIEKQQALAKALEEKALALAEAERLAEVEANNSVMLEALANLEEELGTPYVFAGSTPRGWDCSGLVLWFYAEHFGIELAHSATAQAFSGYEVETPLPGDIVIFGYNESDFHHSSIYVGDNKVIHSGFRSGQQTEFLSLKHPSVENSYVKFVRLVETRP